MQLFAAFSDDGGTTFQEVQVSTGTSNSSIVGPPPPGLRDIGPGDYNRATFYNGRFYASWADNSNSTGNNPDGTLHWDTYTALINVTTTTPPPPGPPPQPGPALASNLVVGSGAGQKSMVRIYTANGVLVNEFQPYADGFAGGVNVASGDVTGDGIADTITAPASHGGADIRVYDGLTGARLTRDGEGEISPLRR